MAHSRKPAIKNGRPKRGQHSKKAKLKAMPIYAAFSIMFSGDNVNIVLRTVTKNRATAEQIMLNKLEANPKFPKRYLVLNINLEPIRISKQITDALSSYTLNGKSVPDETITGIHTTIMQQLTVLMSQILSKSL